ncbi:MAG: glycosyltransferase [Myxococcales bacterium]|nr:glycosyltransferase [Polyangiaceae bacterium]MDW8250489.1 glycosyltransferase [Myxococcales bacterium]
MGRRRILMLTTDTGFGGAERSFSNVCGILAERHEVQACIFSQKEAGHFPVPVPLHELKIPRGDNLLDKGRRLVERVQRVRELKRSLRVDVCISFLEGADYVNALSRTQERVIFSIRGSRRFDEHICGPMGTLRQKVFFPLALRSPDAIVALSEGVGREMKQWYRIPESIPIHVIHNFFDTDAISAQGNEPVEVPVHSFFQRREVLVSHGRLSGEKGLHHLIDVLAVLRRQRPSVALVLVGDGPARQQLRDWARARGLNQADFEGASGAIPLDTDVLFLGHRANPFRYLSRAKLYLLASTAEGFGNAILEAMICGVPVVCVDCPYGPREILAPGTARPPRLNAPERAAHGVLMPMFAGAPDLPQVIEVWANTLSRLLSDPEERTILVAQGYLRSRDFHTDRIAQRWHELIETCTTPRTQRR